MRIVKRPEFLKLPAGTVFMRYEHCWFRELEVKGDTWGNVFLMTSLLGAVESQHSEEMAARCYEMADKGASFPAEFIGSRDGAFEPDETMFAIYEPADVDELIAVLQRANAQARGT